METDIIVGPPGSGKTTELVRIINGHIKDGGNPLVLALTVSAKNEILSRETELDKKSIRTLHSIARELNHVGYGQVNQIANNSVNYTEWNELYPSLKLTANMATNFESPSAYKRGDALMLDYNKQRYSMSENYTASDLSKFVDKWRSFCKKRGLRDFLSLIETCYNKNIIIPKEYTAVIVDEAQDLSSLELALIRRWGEQVGTLVMVGDPYQSLYEWRGTAPEGFIQLKDGDNYRVLDQSYRVPIQIHKCAKKWIKKMPGYVPIDYKPTDKVGIMKQLEMEDVMVSIFSNVAKGFSIRVIGSIRRFLTPFVAMKKLLPKGTDFTISTIHGAKGREADVVYLITNKSYNDYSSIVSGEKEVYRKFYVGLTRARQRLYFVYNDSDNNNQRVRGHSGAIWF